MSAQRQAYRSALLVAIRLYAVAAAQSSATALAAGRLPPTAPRPLGSHQRLRLFHFYRALYSVVV